MPRFSIILPTYNRRDTLARAVRSVQAQTFADWELLITDDGSTDGTRDIIPRDDPRIRVIVQPNSGVARARNRGLQSRSGELVAFLDSDDEWLPHHLELADAFFRAHPGERLLIGEFVQNWSNGFRIRHFEAELTEWFPAIGRRVGSTRFSGPAPDGDFYLRIYSERAPIGSWGAQIVARAGHADAMHYRGRIFDAWRWGWLMLLQSTVVTADAADAVGSFDESYTIASDYPWMAELCRQNVANLLALPVVVKHEFGAGGEELAEGHLAWGKTGARFYGDVLRGFDTLFWNREQRTPELRGVRGHWHLLLAKAALHIGDRKTALDSLRDASAEFGGLDTYALRALLAAVPHVPTARALYRGWTTILDAPGKVRARVRPA